MEGIVAGFLGLCVGILVAIWLNDVSRSMLSSYENLNTQRSFFDVVVNPGTLIISISTTLAVAFITGVIPAFRAHGMSVISILQGTSRSSDNFQKSKKPLWPIVLAVISGIIGLMMLINQIANGHPFYSIEGYRNAPLPVRPHDRHCVSLQ